MMNINELLSEPFRYATMENLAEYVIETGANMKKQFLPDEAPYRPLRLSSLGKIPAIEALAHKLRLIEPTPPSAFDEKSKFIFSFGDWFEAYLNFMMERHGYTLEKQREVTWNGVKGHTDAIYIEDGQECLLEIKTASSYYFEQVKALGYPTDERGYLTQFLAYSESTGIPRERCHWIFLDKGTNNILQLPLSAVPSDLAEQRLNRAKSVIKAFEECEHIDDLYTLVQPPPPNIEKDKYGEYQRHEDGRVKLYPHYSLSNQIVKLAYVIEPGKTRWGRARDYVVDYNYPEHLQEHKPDVYRDAECYDGGECDV